MAISKRLAVVIIGLILLTGCGGAKITKQIQTINPVTNKVDKIIIEETNPQMIYQETIQKMMVAMRDQNPTLEIAFTKSTGASHYNAIESLQRSVGSEIDDISRMLTKRKSENYDIDGLRNALNRLKSIAVPAITTAFFTGVSQGNSNSILPVVKQRQRIDWNAALALIQRTPTTGENWKNGLVEALGNLGIPLAIAGMATVAVQASRSSEEHQTAQTAGGDIVENGDGSNRSTTDITEDSFNEEESIEIEKSYNSGNVQ